MNIEELEAFKGLIKSAVREVVKELNQEGEIINNNVKTYSPEQVAVIDKVTVFTVYDRYKRGEYKGYKRGRLIRIYAWSVDTPQVTREKRKNAREKKIRKEEMSCT
jgi:predicted transcriptional regulator